MCGVAMLQVLIGSSRSWAQGTLAEDTVWADWPSLKYSEMPRIQGDS